MEKSVIKTVAVALLLVGASSAMAQTENGFKEYNVQKDFKDNAFTYFTTAPILASGDKDASNAMTIGWGAMGNIWGGKRPTVTVYVAQTRYTLQFMEKYKYFTVMQFSDPKIMRYLGSHSGRDGDKAKALGLHVAYTKNGTPYYKEADNIIECEIMYGSKLQESGFRNDVPKNMYKNFPAGIHSMYIGEVVGAWKK